MPSLVSQVLLAFVLQGVTPHANPDRNAQKEIVRIQSLLAANDLGQAEQALRSALREQPNDGGLYNLQGILHARRNEWVEAEGDFKNAIQFSPRLSGAYLNLGRVYQAR